MAHLLEKTHASRPELTPGRAPASPPAQPRHEATIIEFPIPAQRSDEYRQHDLGTAEEFYIAEQPFAPQWDWGFRRG